MNRCLIRPLRLLAALVVVASATLLAAPEPGRYLSVADVVVAELIPPAPADDSLTTATDLEVVHQVQLRRTPEQVALARYFVRDTVFQFDAVLGPWFSAARLPFTAEFFAQVEADRFAISSAGKRFWSRPRPPLLDPRIEPCIPLPESGAYPSGHATMAFVRAGLLAEIFPAHRAALRERAQLVAWSRVVGGVHYPTDIVAGRLLGDRLAAEFLRVPSVRDALAQVKVEAALAAAEPLPAK